MSSQATETGSHMKPPVLATHGLSSKMKHIRGLCPAGWLTDTARPHQVWQSQTVGTGIWAPFWDSDLLHSSDSTPLTTPTSTPGSPRPHRPGHHPTGLVALPELCLAPEAEPGSSPTLAPHGRPIV